MVPRTTSIMSVYYFCWIRTREREKKEVTTDGEREESTIPGSWSRSRLIWGVEPFKLCMGQKRAAKQHTGRVTKGQGAHVVRLEARERDGWRLIEARCGWRDPPICQQTGRPPSYPKNLVGQCNMAPPQSLQLAVWALFGVVS